MDERYLQGRHFLKSNWHLVKEIQSDQSRGLPMPPQELPPEEDDSVVALPPVDDVYLGKPAAGGASAAPVLHGLLKSRKSRRAFLAEPLSLQELS